MNVAQERRPDIIELKLILEADGQQLLVAQNQVLPSVNAVAQYRWNGLEGRAPSQRWISSSGDGHTDWTLGVNFSVPLGLRQARANERQREILIVRDRANLRQGIHSMTHLLANNVRNLDQFFEQYDAFRESREAARENLERQVAAERRQFQQVILLNVLQAISDWGNAVSAEANALANYNTELAGMERQSGTILETHGVRFQEERWAFAGPLLKRDTCYPADVRPEAGSESHYLDSDEPAENIFDLSNPLPSRAKSGEGDDTPTKPSLPPSPTTTPKNDAAKDNADADLRTSTGTRAPAPAVEDDAENGSEETSVPVGPPERGSASNQPTELESNQIPDAPTNAARSPREDKATRRQRRRAQKLARLKAQTAVD